MKVYSFISCYETISKIVVYKHQQDDADIMSRVKGIVADETLGNIRDIPQIAARRIVRGGFAVKINYDEQDNLTISIMRKETKTTIENKN